MAVTKTNFINYSRCPRYVALEEIKTERLLANITYEEYKKAKLLDKVKELLGSMYNIAEKGEEDLIDVNNPQLEIMMPYYKKIEALAGEKISNLFDGKTIYAENTFSQESFNFTDNGIKYLCYVDIYNENDLGINIIEVKATTSKKYLVDLETGHRSSVNKKCQKYPIFFRDQKGIYRLKEELSDWKINDEMPEINYQKNRNKLMNRYEKTGKYIYDLAVQRMIIENDIKKSHHKIDFSKVKYFLAVLNHEYIFDGEYNNGDPVYKDDIISLFDFTNLTYEMQPLVIEDKIRIEKYLEELDASEYKLGNYCEYKLPTVCKFSKICFNKIPKYNSSLSYMNNGKGFKDDNGDFHKGLDLINEGYLHMLDIPESWISNINHTIQRNSVINHKPYVDKEKIKIALKGLNYPIYHLDFETFPCPLPRFKGEKCYSQSPFQFSLHIESAPGVCNKDKDHYAFLADRFEFDMREELIKNLCEYIDVEKGGTVFAQNVSFEKGRIKELAEMFPKYKTKLLKMLDMTSDLLYIVRNNQALYLELGFDEENAKRVNYYHEDLNGSYSIKKTLPVLSDLKYEDLDVKNGTEALITYALFSKLSDQEFKVKYSALLEYCKQDTWAMVVILNSLRELVK